MRRHTHSLIVLGLTFIVLVSVRTRTQQLTSNPAEPIALIHANVLDTRDGRIQPDTTMVLRNGRIEAVGSSAPPAGVRVIDVRGRYVTPGLIDAHSHAGDVAAFRRALESGVTTARSGGVTNYADVGFRELVKRGALVGPDVLASGYHVRRQLAADALLSSPLFSDLMAGITTPEGARRAVQMNVSHGVDWIKVTATGAAGSPLTDPRQSTFSEDELTAIVQEAASTGLPVLAHAHGEEGALAAIKAGVRSVEHGTYLSDAALRLMKEKGTYLDPTYTVIVDLSDAGGQSDNPTVRIRARHMLPTLRDTIRRAHRMEIPIVTGSDTDYGPDTIIRIPQEIEHLMELGFSALQALQSATIRNARMLRLDTSIGVLEAGYEADLVVTEKNPIEDITTMQDPLLVISNGRIGLDRLTPPRTRTASARP